MTEYEYTEQQQLYADKMNQSRRAYGRLGLAVVALFAVYLLTSYGLMFATAYLLPDIYDQWWFNWVLNIVPLYLFALPAFWLCLRSVDKGTHDPHYVSRGFIYEKPKVHVGHFALFAVVCFGLMYIGSLIGNGLMSVLSTWTGYDYQNNLSDLADNSPWWMLLLGTVIIAPIGEEFIFRKLFIDRARRYGDGMAIIMSALLFALFHGNFFQFFYAFMVGLVMAYAYTLTGKLYWSVGLHMFMNFMGMMIMPNMLKWLGLEELETLDPENMEAVTQFIMDNMAGYCVYMLVTLVLYGAMAAAVALIIYFACARKIHIGQGDVSLRSGDKVIATFCNVGIPLCIFLLCLFMVMGLIPPPAS